MALPGEIGWIGKDCPRHPKVRLIATPMNSAAGWFIGTYCERCREEDPSPHSRETDYYPTKENLIAEAFAGTVKYRDTDFKGMKLLNNTKALVFEAPHEKPTDKYAVICNVHGRTFLTQAEYDRQMNSPGSTWSCPVCGRSAHFDDATFEAAVEAEQAAYKSVTDEEDKTSDDA